MVGCLWLHIGRSGILKVDADGNPAPEGWMTASAYVNKNPSA